MIPVPLRIAAVIATVLSLHVGLSAQESGPASRPAGAEAFEPVFTFAAFGDWGTKDEHRPAQLAVRDALEKTAKERKLDLVLLLGDNFYKKGITSVDDPLFVERFQKVYGADRFPIPFLATLGNHDYRGDVRAQMELTRKDPRWRMTFVPETSVFGGKPDRPLVEFFNVDTERLCKKKAYRDEDVPKLTAALKKSRARWKVVFGHRPLFSDGAHGDNLTTIDALERTLDQEQVNFYLSGHDHQMQAIQDRDGSGDDKTVYCIAGSGGEVSQKGTESKGSLFQRKENGFLLLELGKDRARLSFRNVHAETLFSAMVGRRSPDRKAVVDKTLVAPKPVKNLFDDEEDEDDDDKADKSEPKKTKN